MTKIRPPLCLFTCFIRSVSSSEVEREGPLCLDFFFFLVGELLKKVGQSDLLVSKEKLRFWCFSKAFDADPAIGLIRIRNDCSEQLRQDL